MRLSLSLYGLLVLGWIGLHPPLLQANPRPSLVLSEQPQNLNPGIYSLSLRQGNSVEALQIKVEVKGNRLSLSSLEPLIDFTATGFLDGKDLVLYSNYDQGLLLLGKVGDDQTVHGEGTTQYRTEKPKHLFFSMRRLEAAATNTGPARESNTGGQASNRSPVASTSDQPLKAPAPPKAPVVPFTDPRDQITYSVVELGGKVWMAENLRHKMPGALLNPKNPSPEYGYLYPWDLALKACPAGWHLATTEEWQALVQELGPAQASEALRSEAAWRNKGSNSAGMNILPAGFYNPESQVYDGPGTEAYFWSATPYFKQDAYFFLISQGGVERQSKNKRYAYSCRCVRD